MSAPAVVLENVPARRSSGRSVALDGFRGLAIVLMVVDHLALFAGVEVLRWFPGRLAMPMFFVLAGHLSGRPPRVRWASVLLVGFMLPYLAPWVDSPNVLVWWVVGSVLLWACARGGVPSWLLAVVALTVAAHGYGYTGNGYDGLQLVGLMAVGSLVPRSAFDVWARLHPVFGWLGRRPLSLYVGHVLALSYFAGAWS